MKLIIEITFVRENKIRTKFRNTYIDPQVGTDGEKTSIGSIPIID